jgi:hypothetical protein
MHCKKKIVFDAAPSVLVRAGYGHKIDVAQINKVDRREFLKKIT